jgi:DNA primase
VLYEDDNHFHCFACGKHGSVIDLVMLAEGVDVRAAIASLRGHAVPVTRVARHIDALPQALHPTVRACIAAAATHYHATLLRTPRALAYLRERGLHDATIARMQLGYADGTLLGALHAAGLDLALAARIGLFGGRGEALHGRVVAPVRDDAGPAWLIGRALTAAQQPKYLGLANGLTRKLPCRFGAAERGAIVVEGVFDLAALLQWGYDARYRLIALLGTGHAHGLDALPASVPIYIALDQDAAGQGAADKLATHMAYHGRVARVLRWSGAKDCGELLQHGEAGRQAFADALAGVSS